MPTAHENRGTIPILWINAASEEALLTSFQALAEVLPDFADTDKKKQRELLAAILRWLERCQKSWLLIFDNADDLSLVPPYLPGQGSILLTTRATAVGWLANSIEVDQMGLVEGTRFLLHRAQRLQASEQECHEATNVALPSMASLWPLTRLEPTSKKPGAALPTISNSISLPASQSW